MEKNTDNKNEGVYLNLKTRLKHTSEIFDYSSSDHISETNTFLNNKRNNLYRLIDNEIVKAEQSQVSNEDDFLVLIRKAKKYYYIDNINYLINTSNSSLLLEKFRTYKNFLWKVINSEPSANIANPNEDYYLEQGDIIKFGKVKYLVSFIYIKEEDINKKNDNNIFTQECKEFKQCEICNENIYRLCKCNEFQHEKCMKKWLNDKKLPDIYNNKEPATVINHFFNIYYCDEVLKKDPKCEDSVCRDCECVRCNTFYPLVFKYGNGVVNKLYEIEYIKELEEAKEKKSETSNQKELEETKQKNTEEEKPIKPFMILESLETNDEVKNSGLYKKYIHEIQLTNEDINIGRGKWNDVIIDHSSVCKDHAVMRYKDGKILLKNKSKKAGTLVLIKEKEFILSKKEAHLQVNKTFIAVKVMEEKDFLKIKNDKSKYPLPDMKK